MKNMKTALSAVLASAMIFGAAMASAETFSASAKGFGGDITVTVTVEDGRITAAEAAGISETPALGGVNTNELLQVVDSTNTPISGLYATGNNVSGMSVAAYVNIEGTGLGFALTSGRLAGANAAAASK